MSHWQPELSPKQIQLFNMGIASDAMQRHPNSPAAIMVDGARYTGKTLGVCHRWCRHLWDTPGAQVALVSKTIKSMTDAGVFRDMTEIVIPEWISSGIGFEFTTRDAHGVPGPMQDSKTRTVLFRVRNRFGGESELKLLSLNHDHEVKQIFKGSRWSGIWLSEAVLFKDAKVFLTMMMQLRMFHLKRHQHLFIGDTNPAEEGEEHWIYKLWHAGRFESEEEEKDFSEYRRALRLLTFYLEDNPWLSDDDIRWIKAHYKKDPGEYAREVEGKWVAGHGNLGKHFADVFNQDVHVIGERDDYIDILPTTKTLYGGWDIGSGTNHAAVAMEKRLFNIGGMDFTAWLVLAELISMKEQIQIRDFALAFQLIMRDIENHAGRKFEWIHWSDDTALNVHRNSGQGYDALEVQLATKGEIVLQGVTKPDGSVRNRVKITRRLLKENRIWFAARCTHCIEATKELHQGSTIKEYVAWGKHKHPWDAYTYPILIESGNELLDEVFRPQASSPTTKLISI